MQFLFMTIFLLMQFNADIECSFKDTQCDLTQQENFLDNDIEVELPMERYDAASNKIYKEIELALANYKPCSSSDNDEQTQCECYEKVIEEDLKPYKAGISTEMLQTSAKYGTRYKLFNGTLYRDGDCMFPARCAGVEHFLLQLLPKLPNLDFVLNSRDWPQLRNFNNANPKAVVFSFSKTKENLDIMYPAWSFWAGGPAISLHPTGIGRWDLLRESIDKASKEIPWRKKLSQGFFRGSRTSDERDALVLLSRRHPKLVDAKYTKNQAWKTPKDTLNAEPAEEVSFEAHCKYKYLFNFRGVAASFRFKHLFLCKSLVFHVGDEWQEFFYDALKPWVHYVPVPKYPNEETLTQLLNFFRKNDELAQQIANRGYEFVWQHLRMSDISCYWLNLLQRYKRLLNYETKYDSTFKVIRG